MKKLEITNTVDYIVEKFISENDGYEVYRDTLRTQVADSGFTRQFDLTLKFNEKGYVVFDEKRTVAGVWLSHYNNEIKLWIKWWKNNYSTSTVLVINENDTNEENYEQKEFKQLVEEYKNNNNSQAAKFEYKSTSQKMIESFKQAADNKKSEMEKVFKNLDVANLVSFKKLVKEQLNLSVKFVKGKSHFLNFTNKELNLDFYVLISKINSILKIKEIMEERLEKQENEKLEQNEKELIQYLKDNGVCFFRKAKSGRVIGGEQKLNLDPNLI